MNDARSPQRAPTRSNALQPIQRAPTNPTNPNRPTRTSKSPPTLIQVEEGYYLPLQTFLINYSLLILLFIGSVLFILENVFWHEPTWKFTLGVVIAVPCLIVSVMQTIALVHHFQRPL